MLLGAEPWAAQRAPRPRWHGSCDECPDATLPGVRASSCLQAMHQLPQCDQHDRGCDGEPDREARDPKPGAPPPSREVAVLRPRTCTPDPTLERLAARDPRRRLVAPELSRVTLHLGKVPPRLPPPT